MLRIFLSAGVMAAMIGAAEAAPKCSPGKIYRVSKKVCVDKATAIRDGVIIARQKAAVTRKVARRAASEKPPAEQSQIETPARSIDPDTTSQIAKSSTARSETTEPSLTSGGDSDRPTAVIVPPVKKITGWATSPFGALVDPWSSEGSRAAPETHFSLRLATER